MPKPIACLAPSLPNASGTPSGSAMRGRRWQPGVVGWRPRLSARGKIVRRKLAEMQRKLDEQVEAGTLKTAEEELAKLQTLLGSIRKVNNCAA